MMHKLFGTVDPVDLEGLVRDALLITERTQGVLDPNLVAGLREAVVFDFILSNRAAWPSREHAQRLVDDIHRICESEAGAEWADTAPPAADESVDTDAD